MKTLLFIQNDDGRRTVRPNPGRNDAARRLFAAANPYRAKRWWLVRCSDAQMGRAVIHSFIVADCEGCSHMPFTTDNGTLLAQGEIND